MIGNNMGLVGYFPSQKKSDKEKDEDWFRDCINSSLALAFLDEGELKRKMQVYADMDNDIINEEEIEKVFNPLQIEYAAFPSSLKNYPLSVPKIDLLQGEELKRRYDWVVKARNDSAISSQQSKLQEMLMEILTDELTKESFDEKEAEARISKFAKYAKYEWKDLNELTATRILQYLWREQDLQDKLNKGFRDALVKGQEVYRIDSVGNEPIVVKVDARKIYAIRRGDSERIEDSDIIVELDYLPVGMVIDEFYEYLTEAMVQKIEDGRRNSINPQGSILNYSHKYPVIYSNLDPGPFGEGFLPLDKLNDRFNLFSLPYDIYGNVRVIRTRWKGRRKVGRLSYFDENGDEQKELVPEDYKIDKDRGESIQWLWINEAYEGTLIADDIYVKLQPREIQMRHFDNISRCFLGYIGTDYGKSLMSRMEPYQYIYNVYMRRLELVLAKYKGPIYELDASKIPDEWEMDKWMYYADVLGWAVVDPFSEGKKGAATGKLAGNFNTTGKVLDPHVGDYIQQIINMLSYIENQMGEIAGVSKQRQGQVDNRETLGGVERAVTQSSHITEKWFFAHDETKRRVLQALLDTAKYTWKKIKSKKLNFVLDDMSRAFLEFSPEELASSEFDLFVSSSARDMELREVIKQLAQTGIQNGLGLSPMIAALREDSITAMARTIDAAEEEFYRRQSEAAQTKAKSDEQRLQVELDQKEKDRELEYYRIDTEAEIEREKLGMEKQDVTPPDDTYLKQQKLNLEERKVALDEAKHSEMLSHEANKVQREHVIKKQQLEETKRHNVETEKISRIKKPSNTKK